MREIKFRCWNPVAKVMIDWQQMRDDHWDLWLQFRVAQHMMQYTGFQDKNNRDVYEGDIFRIEENDEENTVIYIVVVWVKEWAMFTTLRLEDEYPAYLLEGVDAIDETMFWTYTLEDIGSPKHYPCGNIYEHSHLLK